MTKPDGGWLKKTLTLGDLLVASSGLLTIVIVWAVHVEIRLSDMELTYKFEQTQQTDEKTAIEAYRIESEQQYAKLSGKIDDVSNDISDIKVTLVNKQNRP